MGSQSLGLTSLGNTLAAGTSISVHITGVTSTSDFGAGPGVPGTGSGGNAVVGGINLGALTNYSFVFTDGSKDANWQGATKGFVGNVAVNGGASFRTSGGVPYAGTIYTDGSSIGQYGRSSISSLRRLT